MLRSSSILISRSMPYYHHTREMVPYLSVAAGIAYITLHSIMMDNTQRQHNQGITHQINELREEVVRLTRESKPLCRLSSTIPYRTAEE